MVAQYRGTTGLEGAGSEMMAHAGAEDERAAGVVYRAKEEADTLAAEDAYNKLKLKQVDLTYGDKGFLSLKGSAAVNRDVPTEYGVQLRDSAKALSESLGNDYQRQLFSKRAANAQLQLQEQAFHHVAQQSDHYANEVLQGTLDTEARVASTGGDVPSSLVRVNAAIDRHGQRFGAPEEEVTALKLKAADNMWTSKIKSLIYTDPLAAQALYREQEGQIGPANKPILEHEIKVSVQPVEAKRIADRIMRGGALPDLASTLAIAGEPLVNAVIQQESRGDQSAVSSKGAVGVMQVMPDTARQVAAELGLPYDPERLKTDTGYNKTLGTRYLQNMLGRYGGNQTLALAAYNAGPARVDEWIGRFGNPNSGEVSDVDFAAKIPFKETRDYVQKIIPQLSGSPGGSTANDVRSKLGEWVASAENMAETVHPGDPVFRDLVVQNVRGQFGTMVAAQEGQQRKAHGVLVDAAIGANGQAKPLKVDELLSTPEARKAWTMVEPESRQGILSLLGQNAAEMDRTDPRLLQDLFRRVYASEDDPEKIRSSTQLVPFFAHGLGRSGFDWLTKELEASATPEGHAFMRGVETARRTAVSMLRRSLVGSVDPEKADEAGYRFSLDLDQKIDRARKDGKDPRSLLTPGSADYVLKPESIMGFLMPMRQVIADRADAERRKVPLIQTDDEYNLLPVGAIFRTPDGLTRQKPAAEVAAAAAPAKEPQLQEPQLVEEGGKLAKQRTSLQARREAEATAQADFNVKMVEGTIAAGRAVGSAARAAADAVTPPSDAEKAAANFRELIKSGSFRLGSESIISDAVSSGLLNESETTMARSMLAKIAKRRGS